MYSMFVTEHNSLKMTSEMESKRREKLTQNLDKSEKYKNNMTVNEMFQVFFNLWQIRDKNILVFDSYSKI